MRIAFVSTILDFPWGGADVLWTRAAAAALSAGDDVLIAVSPTVTAHPRIDHCRTSGAKLHERSTFTLQRGRRQRWKQALQRMLRSSASLVAALDTFNPDRVVICQGGVFDFLVETGLVEWLNAKSCPFTLVCQSNDALDELSPSHQLGAREVLTRAHNVVFVSTHNREHAFRQSGFEIPHSIVLNNPVELSADPLPLPWPKGSVPRIAVVARLESAAKGLDVLLEAIALTPKEDEWEVDVFGRGPDASRLRTRSAELGVESRVNFAGYEPNIERIWADHHCLLLPSRREGCALAMLEAMACGRPVLTTEVGGARDWVEEGVNGFICRPGDASALAGVLRTGLSQFGRWPEMGTASARIMQFRHDPAPERSLLDSVRKAIR